MGGGVYARAGLSVEQRAALSEARTLRASGEVEKARDVLVEAGINEEAIASIRRAAHEVQVALRATLDKNDYAAFKVAVADSPLSDTITSEADFIRFREAHELKRAGSFEEAEKIFAVLNVHEVAVSERVSGARYRNS